ncbi:unnamed protein product, partial [Urochloa humidicola]
ADGASRRGGVSVTVILPRRRPVVCEPPLLETGDCGGGGRRGSTPTTVAVEERSGAGKLRCHDGLLGLRGHVAASLLVRGLHHAVVV